MAISLSPKSLAHASAAHPWRVIVAWVLIMVLSVVVLSTLMKGATTTVAKLTNNADSVKGNKILEDKLRGPMKANEAVIIESDSKSVDDPTYKAYVTDIAGKIKGLGPNVIESSFNYYETNEPSLVSQSKKATIIPITMAGTLEKANDNIKDVLSIVKDANGKDGFTVHVAGVSSVNHDFNTQSEKDLSRTEYGPIPIALVILVVVFGALLISFVPVVLAFMAIFVAIALVALFGHVSQFSFFVTNMIAMMGLAVGIDYCLFIVSRYREERARGVDKVDALANTGATAGKTVLFSGMTVVFALAGLLVVPHTIFRSLSAGAIFVVLAAIAASLTLLPAILSLMGDKVNALTLPFMKQDHSHEGQTQAGGFWDKVAHTVMGHAVLSVVISAGLLILASIPYFGIKLGFSGVSTLPNSFQSKQGFDALEREFKGGQVYPAEVVINGDAKSPAVAASIEKLKTIVAKDSTFGPATYKTNDAGDVGLLSIQLLGDPGKHSTTGAIKRLRHDYIPQAFDKGGPEVLVTGAAAGNADFFDTVSNYTPLVFALVLTLSFVLLMLVFRSIVVPTKAIILNLLSVGAAYGLLVLVFQDGVGNEIFGFQKIEAIEAWLPLFLFSILFGLSMDYHVFLLSRIKERYDMNGGDNTAAVAAGLGSTGRLITGAALIMVVVFAGFAMGDLVMFQQMGFGLGVAVLIDATVIRSILVPASMKLLGAWNWYLPPVLSWLPRIGLEHGETAPSGLAGAEGLGGGS